jgi:hypothetical protein
MDKNLRRLLIIAVLVSYFFCSSAQNPTSAEEGTSRDVYTRNDCNPHTHVCTEPHNDTKSTKEAVTEEGSSGEEHHDKEKICIPGTPLCNDGHPDPKPTKKADTKPTKEAVMEEDTSEFKPLTVCDPITHQCQVEHISESDTVDPPVESSRKEDASKSEDSIICDPITKLCNGAQTNSVISEPTKSDLPEADSWEFNPNPGSWIVCNPETKKCTGPKLKSLDIESAKAAQIEDFIQEEKQGMNFNACKINHDGTKSCQDPKPAFGIAQPRVEAA